MVKLASTFSCLHPIKALIIGDLMLDTYTVGKARRISPEAPVPIVHVHHEEHRPGGAGNVVLNLISLGAQTTLIGRIGSDLAGQYLHKSLEKENVDLRFLVTQSPYMTPVKNRIMADNQQVVRVDHEQIVPLSNELEKTIIESLPFALQEIQVIAISDYGKGFLTPTLLKALIHQAQQQGILIITDPKGNDFSKYQGTTVIKPNLAEAYAAANLPSHRPLEEVASRLLDMTKAEKLMITRSEEGISLFDSKGNRDDFPVHIKQVKDVTGAGDTVLAMLACALGNRLSYIESAHLCNIAAGIAIEYVGCTRITLSDLAHRLLEKDVGNKVFDEEHLFALQQVLKQKEFILLSLSSLEGVDQQLFSVIKQLEAEEASLLIYVQDFEPNELFIQMLASLKEIDFIVIHQESLRKICENKGPLEVYLFENKQLKQISHFSVLLEAQPYYI
jgi:rfaE bifunctional protein kinase chain/domain